MKAKTNSLHVLKPVQIDGTLSEGTPQNSNFFFHEKYNTFLAWKPKNAVALAELKQSAIENAALLWEKCVYFSMGTLFFIYY